VSLIAANATTASSGRTVRGAGLFGILCLTPRKLGAGVWAFGGIHAAVRSAADEQPGRRRIFIALPSWFGSLAIRDAVFNAIERGKVCESKDMRKDCYGCAKIKPFLKKEVATDECSNVVGTAIENDTSNCVDRWPYR
jgi:hypothetical protein